MFDPMQFINNLSYMGLGMLGIFVVMGIIIAVTALLNRLLPGKDDEDQ